MDYALSLLQLFLLDKINLHSCHIIIFVASLDETSIAVVKCNTEAPLLKYIHSFIKCTPNSSGNQFTVH